VLLSRDRNQLLEWRENIEQYLCRELKLELNQKRQRLQPVTNGIDFLGYVIRGDYLLVRRCVVNNLHARLREYEALLVKEGCYFRRYLFDEDILDKLTATISSYLGHFRMANTYSLCCSLWARDSFLKQYYEFDPEKQKLARKYKYPKGFRKARQQYCHYRWMFPGDVLLFQVGRFFEFYHEADWKTAQILSLTEMKENKRGARYGFPVTLLNRYFRLLLHEKHSVTVIPEREQYWTRIKERLPRYRFEYM
jgi:RNA-directed DNA polymerase